MHMHPLTTGPGGRGGSAGRLRPQAEAGRADFQVLHHHSPQLRTHGPTHHRQQGHAAEEV